MAVFFKGHRDTPDRVEYEGAVLGEREKNYHDDSDFFALVWDDEKGEVKSVMFDTTRGVTNGGCTVDATDEVKAKADAWAKNSMRSVIRSDLRAKAEAVDNWKGKRVLVERGRKVKPGTEGVVFWTGESPGWGYNSRPEARIGISPSGVKNGSGRYDDGVFLPARHCKVLDEFEYPTDEEVERLVARVNWLTPYAYWTRRAGMMVV